MVGVVWRVILFYFSALVKLKINNNLFPLQYCRQCLHPALGPGWVCHKLHTVSGFFSPKLKNKYKETVCLRIGEPGPVPEKKITLKYRDRKTDVSPLLRTNLSYSSILGYFFFSTTIYGIHFLSWSPYLGPVLLQMFTMTYINMKLLVLPRCTSNLKWLVPKWSHQG